MCGIPTTPPHPHGFLVWCEEEEVDAVHDSDSASESDDDERPDASASVQTGPAPDVETLVPAPAPAASSPSPYHNLRASVAALEPTSPLSDIRRVVPETGLPVSRGGNTGGAVPFGLPPRTKLVVVNEMRAMVQLPLFAVPDPPPPPPSEVPPATLPLADAIPPVPPSTLASHAPSQQEGSHA